MDTLRIRRLALPRPARLDRAWLATGAILAALAFVAPAQALDSAGFTLESLWQTAPWLLLSIAVAAWTRASGADQLVARVFSGRPVRMIVLAAAFGGLSPFCSCGVIPLIAALLGMGVPLAPVMAFWLASPVIDPAMFLLTAGLLDTEFALAKTVAAIGLGLAGRFGRESLATTAFLGKWLTLAFLLESLMLAYVPAEWIAGVLGGNGLAPIATATLVGVPAYLNGYAALPLVSGLIEQGMAPGAALAFLVAGGVTSIPAAIAVFALVRLRVFVLYVVFALVGSFTAGLLFQQWLALGG